jgi:hypothetical protein
VPFPAPPLPVIVSALPIVIVPMASCVHAVVVEQTLTVHVPGWFGVWTLVPAKLPLAPSVPVDGNLSVKVGEETASPGLYHRNCTKLLAVPPLLVLIVSRAQSATLAGLLEPAGVDEHVPAGAV